MKKGMSLVELVVAVSIFIVVTTISVGGFVAISKTKALISNMKESQQRMRTAGEMISRYARQAEKIKMYDLISGNKYRTIELYFDLDDPGARSGVRFATSPTSGVLNFWQCSSINTETLDCDGDNWTFVTNLFGVYSTNSFKLSATDTYFTLVTDTTPYLNYRLKLTSSTDNYQFLNNELDVENSVLLEGLK